jgi:hypothetical protein
MLDMVLSIPEFSNHISSMPNGYFMCSCKDKTSKVKEMPPPVNVGLNSLSSLPSFPPLMQIHHAHAPCSQVISVHNEFLMLPMIAKMGLGNVTCDFVYLGTGRALEDKKALTSSPFHGLPVSNRNLIQFFVFIHFTFLPFV